jgi:hypothetical protein
MPLEQHKVLLTEAQTARIIESLEDFLSRSSDASDQKEFNPWRAETAAAMLEQHYGRQKNGLMCNV